MAKVRVLVVEDSITVRKWLCQALRSDREIEVVGEAADGPRAVALCRELRPSVVTLDMALPSMDGLAVAQHIMAYCPTPILVVSSSTNRGELLKTYDALAAGAVDVLEKPDGDQPDGSWEQKLISTVKLVSRIRVITHWRRRREYSSKTARSAAPTIVPAPGQSYQIVAVGASTGGPGAIVEVLRGLPPRFSLPVIIVLHINRLFGASFAEWLNGQTDRPVAYAQDGEQVASLKGRVVVAPPDQHLVVQGGCIRLTIDPERHSCRPSVDVLFESVAQEYGPSSLACLLTGMGRDGAAGLLKVRRAGGFTIAQDETTSIVYGMSREAVLLGAAERVLPLQDIGPALTSMARRENESKL